MVNQSILDKITLCTFSTGSTMVREVLEDWIDFLGNKPKEIIFAVSPKHNPPVIYEQLQTEGLIDRVIYLDSQNLSPAEIDPKGIRIAIEAAHTQWILLVKLDTLPYRKNHKTWLQDSLEIIEEYKYFGLTGSGIYDDLQLIDSNYAKTQKYSNNFSLFRKEDWLQIHDQYIGKNFDRNWFINSGFTATKSRFATEAAVEDFLQKHNQYMLVHLENTNWSVFHINLWGEQLQKVRQSYLKRENITPYLNQQQSPNKILIYPWDKYYGYPKPSQLKMFRIFLGKWRRKIFKF